MFKNRQTLFILILVLILTYSNVVAWEEKNSTGFLDKLVNEVRHGREDMVAGGIAGGVVGAATGGAAGAVIGSAGGAVGNAVKGSIERAYDGTWGEE